MPMKCSQSWGVVGAGDVMSISGAAVTWPWIIVASLDCGLSVARPSDFHRQVLDVKSPDFKIFK